MSYFVQILLSLILFSVIVLIYLNIVHFKRIAQDIGELKEQQNQIQTNLIKKLKMLDENIFNSLNIIRNQQIDFNAENTSKLESIEEKAFNKLNDISSSICELNTIEEIE